MNWLRPLAAAIAAYLCFKNGFGSAVSISADGNTSTTERLTITNDGTVGDITGVTAGTGLTGGGTSGDVTLNWTAGTFDSIEILRDQVLIDTLGGGDTTYTDPGLAAGNYFYQVQGVCAGNIGAAGTTTANVASYGGETDVIFGVEGVDQIDSVAPTSMTNRMLRKGSENVLKPALFSDMTESQTLPNRSTTRCRIIFTTAIRLSSLQLDETQA